MHIFDMIRQRKSSTKKSKKGGAKGSFAFLKESTKLCCVSPDSYPRKSILYEPGKLGSKNTLSNSPKARGTKLEFGKEREHRQELSKSAPYERSPCAPEFGERSHEETLHQERCARKGSVGFCDKYLQPSTILIKLSFTLLWKPGQRWRPLQKLQKNENSWLTL